MIAFASRRRSTAEIPSVGCLVADRLAGLDGRRAAAAAAPAAAASTRPPHWSEEPGRYHVRVADLSDETTRAIGKAGATWYGIHRALRRQERKGHNSRIRDAARLAILTDHGIRGLARDTGVERPTVRRHLRRLTELGLIELVRVKVGKRHQAVLIRVTVRPEHCRPTAKTGSKRYHPPGQKRDQNDTTSRYPISKCLPKEKAAVSADLGLSSTPTTNVVERADPSSPGTTPPAGLTAGKADREEGSGAAVRTVNTNVGSGSGTGTGEPEPEPEPATGDPPAPAPPPAAGRTTETGSGGAWRDPRQLPHETTSEFLARVRAWRRKPADRAADDDVAELEAIAARVRLAVSAERSAEQRERWLAERDPTNVEDRRQRMLAQCAELVAAGR